MIATIITIGMIVATSRKVLLLSEDRGIIGSVGAEDDAGGLGEIFDIVH